MSGRRVEPLRNAKKKRKEKDARGGKLKKAQSKQRELTQSAKNIWGEKKRGNSLKRTDTSSEMHGKDPVGRDHQKTPKKTLCP